MSVPLRDISELCYTVVVVWSVSALLYFSMTLILTLSALVDIYDGDTEPMIYHGKTLTSTVSLRDVCVAISKYAFQASPYPVLVSAEVHCSVAQQDKMVSIMNEIFGDSLVQAPVEGRPKIEKLPSPEELKHKFLLKVGFLCCLSLVWLTIFILGQEPLCRRATCCRSSWESYDS